jgi:hypothetical protein
VSDIVGKICATLMADMPSETEYWAAQVVRSLLWHSHLGKTSCEGFEVAACPEVYGLTEAFGDRDEHWLRFQFSFNDLIDDLVENRRLDDLKVIHDRIGLALSRAK